MRATLEASQNGLVELKQDVAIWMNMMTRMDKMDSGIGSHMRGAACVRVWKA